MCSAAFRWKLVQEGERVGIIGHNGCGKTTLFMLLCGVLTPRSGRYFAVW
jgi:cobalt/nickel transport system ATP-binding protein